MNIEPVARVIEPDAFGQQHKLIGSLFQCNPHLTGLMIWNLQEIVPRIVSGLNLTYGLSINPDGQMVSGAEFEEGLACLLRGDFCVEIGKPLGARILKNTATYHTPPAVGCKRSPTIRLGADVILLFGYITLGFNRLDPSSKWAYGMPLGDELFGRVCNLCR